MGIVSCADADIEAARRRASVLEAREHDGTMKKPERARISCSDETAIVARSGR